MQQTTLLDKVFLAGYRYKVLSRNSGTGMHEMRAIIKPSVYK